MKLIRIGAAVALAATHLSAAAFTNGGFETPGIGGGGVGPIGYVGGSSLGAWTVTGTAIDYGKTGASHDGLLFAAYEGSYAVDVTGRIFETGGGVEQTFDVTPLTTYEVIFALGRFPSTLRDMAGVPRVRVLLDGVSQGDFENASVSTSYVWQLKSFQFTAGAGQNSATLRFFDNQSGALTVHAGLDAVQINVVPGSTPGPAPIPEPSTAGFALAALGAAAARRYFRAPRFS